MSTAPILGARTVADTSGRGQESAQRAQQMRVEVTRRIKQLGKDGKAREAVGQLASLARLGIQPDTRSATALIGACVQARQMRMAKAAFDELFQGGLEPDEVTFCTLVRGYGKEGDWEAITQLLSSMQSMYGQSPTTAVYTALLEICARTKDDERGEELLLQMRARDLKPDRHLKDAVQSRRFLRSALRRTYA